MRTIKTIEEARQYLAHPVLGKRLLECSETLLGIEGTSASKIFGHIDGMKLKSSMTLFTSAADPDSVFGRVLDRYYYGQRDAKTLKLLEELKGEEGKGQ